MPDIDVMVLPAGNPQNPPRFLLVRPAGCGGISEAPRAWAISAGCRAASTNSCSPTWRRSTPRPVASSPRASTSACCTSRSFPPSLQRVTQGGGAGERRRSAATPAAAPRPEPGLDSVGSGARWRRRSWACASAWRACRSCRTATAAPVKDPWPVTKIYNFLGEWVLDDGQLAGWQKTFPIDGAANVSEQRLPEQPANRFPAWPMSKRPPTTRTSSTSPAMAASRTPAPTEAASGRSITSSRSTRSSRFTPTSWAR